MSLIGVSLIGVSLIGMSLIGVSPIGSRLPDLNFRQSHKTVRSDRAYKLHSSQVSIWTGFEREVRRETAPVLRNPINFVPPVLANEYHVVATESGAGP